MSHSILQLNTKYTEQKWALKDARDKPQVTYTGKPIRVTMETKSQKQLRQCISGSNSPWMTT